MSAAPRTPRLGLALENMGWTVDVIGGRTVKITATRPDLANARIEVYIRSGFDAYQAWSYISGGKIIAHHYTHGNLLDYLQETR